MSKHSRYRAVCAAGAVVLVGVGGTVAAQANPTGAEPQQRQRKATSAGGLAPFFTPTADPLLAPASPPKSAERPMTFAWQFRSSDGGAPAADGDVALRKRAGSYDGTQKVPEPGALLTLGVAIAATGFGMAVGRRRAADSVEEWDGSDDSVLAS
ncbi:MAG TPA: hypothetical protein VM490_04475 [Armatimonadaceae bacterium]|nr:hypothetical protein [Armatimonadaceae bacterium]